MTSIHKTVLLHESVEALNLKEDSNVLDATINGGGHSEAIVHVLTHEGTLIGFDLDHDALARSRQRLSHADARIVLVETNFRYLSAELAKLSIEKIDAALFDLGWSQDQFAPGSGRGFSFQHDEPLAMTYGNREKGGVPFTARDIVNSWDLEHIADILAGYGEEQFARRIAAAIVERREAGSIESTSDLVAIIESAVPAWYRHRRIHPATKTFQALRIAVNDEIRALEDALPQAAAQLRSEGRLAVISFHSIEDRVVKHAFKRFQDEGKGTVLTKKSIVAGEREIRENPRARSAKLRILQTH